VRPPTELKRPCRVKSARFAPISQGVTIALLLPPLVGILLVTQLMRRRASRTQRDLRSIFDTAPIATIVLDATDRVVEANTAMSRIVGGQPGDLAGRRLVELVHADDRALLHVVLAELRHDVSAGLETEVRLCHPAREAPVTVSIHAVQMQRRRARDEQRMLLQVLDITERKDAEARLQHLADHDTLTGLLNRRRFEQELARHLAHTRRYGAEGAAIVIDLDRFKPVNDTFGHAAGDRVLAEVGRVLRERLRGTDAVARLGGDEFAILLQRVDRDGAAAVAQSLVETVRAQVASADEADDARGVTISVGVVMFEGCAAPSAERFLAAADLAMYEAKAAGGDGFAFFAERPAIAPTLAA
jgi:diguanylate cyclase (GGDEF)-like protein/PAS domain S-box-containing protein